MIDITPDVMLIALELLELAAHHEETFLRIKHSRIRRLQISAGNGIEARLHLPQSAGRLGVALRQTIDFRAGLLQEQIDLFELLLSLLQLSRASSSSRAGIAAAPGALGTCFFGLAKVHS